MTRNKVTAYMDEDLPRSVGILAAKRDGKIYEVFEEALRLYLEEASGSGRHEWQSRPKIPLLSGGQDPTLGQRFEEGLYPSKGLALIVPIGPDRGPRAEQDGGLRSGEVLQGAQGPGLSLRPYFWKPSLPISYYATSRQTPPPLPTATPHPYTCSVTP